MLIPIIIMIIYGVLINFRIIRPEGTLKNGGGSYIKILTVPKRIAARRRPSTSPKLPR